MRPVGCLLESLWYIFYSKSDQLWHSKVLEICACHCRTKIRPFLLQPLNSPQTVNKGLCYYKQRVWWIQLSSPRDSKVTQAWQESTVFLVNKNNLIWTKMAKVREADLIVKMRAMSSLLSKQSVWLSKEPGQLLHQDNRGPTPAMLTFAEICHCNGPWVLGRTKYKAVQCCLL